MKKIIAILLLSTSLSAFADSASPLHDGTGTNHVVALAKDDLLSFFDSVAAQGTNVCLKFKAQGARYLCITNGQGNGHKMSSYGETIILPEGGTLSLHERHSSLSFEPIKTACGARGFLVRKKMDLRSYGEKEVLEKKGCLLFVQSDGDGDEDDDSCAFKGVVLKAAPPEVGVSREGKDIISGRICVPDSLGGTNITRKVIFKGSKIDRAAQMERARDALPKSRF